MTITKIKETIRILAARKEAAYTSATAAFGAGDTETQRQQYKTADLIQIDMDAALKAESKLYANTYAQDRYDDLLN